MKPLILEFKETANAESFDYSAIEYDSNLNLNICIQTKTPAITILSMDTVIKTKSSYEGVDSDKNVCQMKSSFSQENTGCFDAFDNDLLLNPLLDTETRTLAGFEDSDSDRHISMLYALMDTSTITESVETTDSDRNIR